MAEELVKYTERVFERISSLIENSRNCLAVAANSEEQAAYALRHQLTWTHVKTLLYGQNKLKRHFYLKMANVLNLGFVFKNSYSLDFLGLKNTRHLTKLPDK